MIFNYHSITQSRTWLKDIDDRRWDKYNKHMEHEQEIIHHRAETQRPGKSCVGYNIISNEYLKSKEGQQLKEHDAVLKVRWSILLTCY